jgi:uncharacterized protein (DUF1330 family)
MAKGYWMGAYRSVRDANRLAAYGVLAGPAVENAGGRFLVRGGTIEAHEAGLAERTVIVEFDSFDTAKAAYQSAEYQKALDVLGGTVERDVRIVEGMPE